MSKGHSEKIPGARLGSLNGWLRTRTSNLTKSAWSSSRRRWWWSGARRLAVLGGLVSASAVISVVTTATHDKPTRVAGRRRQRTDHHRRLSIDLLSVETTPAGLRLHRSDPFTAVRWLW